MSISSAGDVAWTSSRMAMSAQMAGKEVTLFGRLSAVFEKRGNKWLFTHLHYSVPAVDQSAGKSFPDNNIMNDPSINDFNSSA